MRRSKIKLNKSLKNQIKKTFAQVVADIKDLKESDIFLNDFLTDAEYETFAKRLAISYWLRKKRSYSNIKNNLKVSSATIAESSSNLNKPGIELAMKKLEAEEWANKWSEKIKKVIR